MGKGIAFCLLGVACCGLVFAGLPPNLSSPSTFATLPAPPSQDNRNPLDQGGETCADATPITSLPYCDTGTTLSRINNYVPPCLTTSTAPDVVYSLTPTVTQVVSVSLCGSAYNTVLHIWRGCPTAGGVIVCCNDNTCGLQSCCQNVTLAPGATYFFIVDGSGAQAGNYIINVIAGQGCPGAPCAPDSCPYPDRDIDPANNTCGSALPVLACSDTTCGEISPSNDVDWYVLNISGTQCVTVTIDVFADDTPGWFPFGGGLDPKVALAAADCNTLLAQDDNGGTGNDARLVSNCLPPGTYRVRVDNVSSTAPGGPYIIAVACTPCQCPNPCVVQCPSGSLPENEPCPNFPDNFNGGCNTTPPAFTPIQCGQIFCGTSTVVTGAGRDTDWYSLNLTTSDSVTWCVRAEFPVEIMIMRPGPAGCADRDTVARSTALPCSLACLRACLEPGSYALYVAPNTAVGFACADYVAQLTCTGCLTPPPCPYPALDLEPANNNCATFNPQVLCADTLCGAISALGDEDWYLLSMQQSPCGQVIIDVFADDTPGGWPFGQGLDPRVWLYSADCAVQLAFDDNGGIGNDARLISPCLPPGPYHILIEGTGAVAPTFGPYILAVHCTPCQCEIPCAVQCNGIPEGEPCPNIPDNYNGGCGTLPPHFQPIANGQTVCGTASAGEFTPPDQDWFNFTLDWPSLVVWCVTAEFPVAIGLFAPGPNGCLDADTIACARALTCSTACVSACLAPGDYAVNLVPVVAGALPCSDYRAQLVHTICTPEICEAPDSVVIQFPTFANPNIRLDWPAVPAADSYRIYRSADPLAPPSPATYLATTTGLTYVDAGVTNLPSVKYFYTVVSHCPYGGCP